MSADCISCGLVKAYVANGDELVNNFMNVAFEPMLAIFASVSGIWFVVQGVKMGLGKLDVHGAAEQIILLVLGASALVSLKYGVAASLYKATMAIMFGLPALFTESGGSGSEVIVNLVASIEAAFASPINMARALMDGAGWFDKIGYFFFTVFLLVPFVLMMIVFLTQVAIGLFRIITICLLLPFIVAVSSFPWGREQILVAGRTLLGSIITMVTVTTVFSLVMKGVEELASTGEKLGTDITNDNTWSDYILIMLLSYSGAALVNEAVSIASTITQAALNAASSGAMMSGIGRGATAPIRGAVGAYKAYKMATSKEGKAVMNAGKALLSGGASVVAKGASAAAQYASGAIPKSQNTDAFEQRKKKVSGK